MSVFRADDGREIDELDLLKALKYYEFLFHKKHSTSTANKASNGGNSPKPAAKLRKALKATDESRGRQAHVEVKNGHKIITRIVKA